MQTSEARFLRGIFAGAAIIIILTVTAYGRAFGATESVLHSFVGFPGDGNESRSGLVKDASGNLYGTTLYGGNNHYHNSAGDGAVFMLAPNSSGGWTESIIWDFGSGVDGWLPYAGLIVDSAGNLYGTTNRGGTSNSGTVFELSPGSAGWTEKFLYSFGSVSGDGTGPRDRLTMDTASGNLYGTTGGGGSYGFGTVFKLSPIGTGGYSETILYSFGSGADGASPFGGVIRDSAGNLYGTTLQGGTSNVGTAFELLPPTMTGSPWTEKLLWTFGSGTDGELPYASLTMAMDGTGNLYGTTGLGGPYQTHYAFNNDNGGTVFKLSPPSLGGSLWTETILWNFGGATGSGKKKVTDGQVPEGSLLLDSSGDLIGTTEGGGTNGKGTSFKLAPPSGTVSAWTETILWNFASGADGATPACDLTKIDGTTNLYGTTYFGGTNNIGTVFKITQ